MKCIYNPPPNYWVAANDDKISDVGHVVEISSNYSKKAQSLGAGPDEPNAGGATKFNKIAIKALQREISKHSQGNITHQTLGMFKSRLNSRLIPYFGEVEVNKIGYEQVADFVNYLHQYDIKPVTIKQYLGLLKRVLTVALEAELIYKIPLFPKLKPKAFQGEVLPAESTERYSESASNCHHRIRISRLITG